jgi:hypothetical protein
MIEIKRGKPTNGAEPTVRELKRKSGRLLYKSAIFRRTFTHQYVLLRLFPNALQGTRGTPPMEDRRNGEDDFT